MLEKLGSDHVGMDMIAVDEICALRTRRVENRIT